jgi:hypothetical protein
MATHCDQSRAMHNLVHCLWTTCGDRGVVHTRPGRITPLPYQPVRRWG